MSDEKDATGIDDQEVARGGNDHDLPKGCWVLLGYSFALVLMVGGMMLLTTLVHFASIRRIFLLGNSIGIVVVSLVILAGGVLLAIATTKSLH